MFKKKNHFSSNMVTWQGRRWGPFAQRRLGPFAPPLPTNLKQHGFGKIRKRKRKYKKKQRGGGPAMMAMMAAPLLMPLISKMIGG